MSEREFVDSIGVTHRPLKLWAVGARFRTTGETVEKRLTGTVTGRQLKEFSSIQADTYEVRFDGASTPIIMAAWLLDRCEELSE